MLMALDINGMESKPNLLKTLGTNYFKITHWFIDQFPICLYNFEWIYTVSKIKLHSY